MTFSKQQLDEMLADADMLVDNDNSARVHQDCGCHVKALVAELEKAQAAIETLRKYSEVTWDLWDSDQDHKVGKRLRCLAGRSTGYDATVDAALALRKAEA